MIPLGRLLLQPCVSVLGRVCVVLTGECKCLLQPLAAVRQVKALMRTLQKGDGKVCLDMNIVRNDIRYGALLAVTAFLLCASACRAQNALKVGVGVSGSSMRTSLPIDVYDDRLWTCSPFVGIDYLEHRYWYLSSGLRYVRVGGKDRVDYNLTGDPSLSSSTIEWDCLQLNTTFRLQYPLRDMKLYAGAGLFMNGRISGGDVDAYGSVVNVRRMAFGEVFEFGITSTCKRVKLDFNVAYNLGNGHAATLGATTFRPSAWFISLSAGYIM